MAVRMAGDRPTNGANDGSDRCPHMASSLSRPGDGDGLSGLANQPQGRFGATRSPRGSAGNRELGCPTRIPRHANRTPEEEGRVLDEFERAAGYHKEFATRILDSGFG